MSKKNVYLFKTTRKMTLPVMLLTCSMSTVNSSLEDYDNILVSLVLHLNKIKTSLTVLLNILAKSQQCFTVYTIDPDKGFQISLLLTQNLALCSGIFPTNFENSFSHLLVFHLNVRFM